MPYRNIPLFPLASPLYTCFPLLFYIYTYSLDYTREDETLWISLRHTLPIATRLVPRQLTLPPHSSFSPSISPSFPSPPSLSHLFPPLSQTLHPFSSLSAARRPII